MRYFPFSVFWIATLLVCGLQETLGQSGSHTVQSVPNPKSTSNGYVSNPDNIIGPQDVATLNQLIAEMEDSTTAQVAVVIVQSIGNENPKAFTTELFNTWGIGQAGIDNGLLIFTVMDQRRTEFETGYGLEGVLPDVVCYRIGMQKLVPEFKQGRYGQGLINAVRQIKLVLEDPAAAEEISANPVVRSSPYRSRQMKNFFGFQLGPAEFLIALYLGISTIICLFLLFYALSVLWSREELYDKYRRVQSAYWLILAILFPVPYLFLYIYLKKTLHKLRTQPRFSRETGAELFLLSEEEEDRYLEHGQITEEEIGSVDYDVWRSEAKDETLILRYKKRWTSYQRCPKCGYLTYSKAYSRTIRSATYSSTGLREIVHKCKSCGHTKTSTQTIPKKQRSSSSSGSSWSSGGGGGGSWGGGSSGGGGAGVSW